MCRMFAHICMLGLLVYFSGNAVWAACFQSCKALSALGSGANSDCWQFSPPTCYWVASPNYTFPWAELTASNSSRCCDVQDGEDTVASYWCDECSQKCPQSPDAREFWEMQVYECDFNGYRDLMNCKSSCSGT